METENLTVDPLAKLKRLSYTDLTRAGKARQNDTSRGVYGEVASKVVMEGMPAVETSVRAPDSQNPFRFLIARSSEKPSKLEGNT